MITLKHLIQIDSDNLLLVAGIEPLTFVKHCQEEECLDVHVPGMQESSEFLETSRLE